MTDTFEEACKKADEKAADLGAELTAKLEEQRKEQEARFKEQAATDSKALIDELARKSRIAYDQARTPAAEALQVRTSTLDEEVRERREEIEVEETPALYPHWETTPCEEPVDGAALLQAIVGEIRRFVFLSNEQAMVVALWIVFTWLHSREEIVTHSPMLLVTSAEKDSGKTTLIKVCSFLVRRGLANSMITGPALFRSIEKWQPTFVIDEADSALVDNDDLRQVVNSGWTRGDGIVRCDPNTQEPFLFSTFAPKAIGMKGRKLPDTTLSRCLTITMKPKRPDSPSERTEDFNHLDNPTFARLRSQILRWTEDSAGTLAKIKPEAPFGFYNRRRANWQPLLAIAEVAGLKDAAHKAATAIEAAYASFDPSLKIQLLGDIPGIFAEQGTDRSTSASLVAALNLDETKPWATFNRGKPLTQNQLARLLRDFDIRPKEFRIGAEVRRGYFLAQFEDAIERHLAPLLPAPPPATATPLQGNDFNGLEEKQTATEESPVAVQNAVNPLKDNDCSGVAVQRPPSGEDGDEVGICAQCGAAEPGPLTSFQMVEGEVRLHRECLRFWLKDHPQPQPQPTLRIVHNIVPAKEIGR